MNNKNLKGVDVGKLIAALLIILLHATECGDYIACEIKFALTRFSVPFFFITSGWLLSKIFENQTYAEQKKYIRKFTLKLLLLYGIWSLIIYLPFLLNCSFRCVFFLHLYIFYNDLLLRQSL